MSFGFACLSGSFPGNTNRDPFASSFSDLSSAIAQFVSGTACSRLFLLCDAGIVHVPVSKSNSVDDLVEEFDDLPGGDGSSVAPVPFGKHVRPKHPTRLLRILALCLKPPLDVFVGDEEDARPAARIGARNPALRRGRKPTLEVIRSGGLSPCFRWTVLGLRGRPIIAVSAEAIRRSAWIDASVQPLAVLQRELSCFG
jgi:hypothetical protein